MTRVRHDPWPWVALASLVCLLWTAADHPFHPQQEFVGILQTLEQQYVTTNRQLKRVVDTTRKLTADVERTVRQNQQYQDVIGQHEGRTLPQPQQQQHNMESSDHDTTTNHIDSVHIEQAEQLEQAYLERIDELEDQMARWKEKSLFQEFGNRFPTFRFQGRMTTITNNNNNRTQEVQLQLRFNLKQYPVEIALLYQMVRTQQFDGLVLDFVVATDSIIRLQHVALPAGLPTWPVHHRVHVQEHSSGNWFVVAEPTAHLLPDNAKEDADEDVEPPPDEEAAPQNLAHILKGFELLRDFQDTTTKGQEQILRVEVFAAERVVPRRIPHTVVAAPVQES